MSEPTSKTRRAAPVVVVAAVLALTHVLSWGGAAVLALVILWARKQKDGADLPPSPTGRLQRWRNWLTDRLGTEGARLVFCGVAFAGGFLLGTQSAWWLWLVAVLLVAHTPRATAVVERPVRVAGAAGLVLGALGWEFTLAALAIVALYAYCGDGRTDHGGTTGS